MRNFHGSDLRRKWTTQRWLAPLSVVLSLGLLLAILVYSLTARFNNTRAPFSLQGNAYDISQTPEVAGAGSIAPRAIQPLDQDKGELQKKVSASEATTFLEITTGAEIPSFSTNRLSVKRGEVVSLTFRNQSDPQYRYRDSWVLTRPNRAGEAAVAASQAGPLENFIPQGPDVLAKTRMLRSGESETIFFRAPSKSGDYPFMSTFPGHSQVMKGVLHVD